MKIRQKLLSEVTENTLITKKIKNSDSIQYAKRIQKPLPPKELK